MASSPASRQSNHLLSKEEAEELHAILRAEVRAYVDRRIMDEEARIAEDVAMRFESFASTHPDIATVTYADVLYRLTLASIYNCFQFMRKSVRDPANTALATQLTAEIALQLTIPSLQKL